MSLQGLKCLSSSSFSSEQLSNSFPSPQGLAELVLPEFLQTRSFAMSPACSLLCLPGSHFTPLKLQTTAEKYYARSTFLVTLSFVPAQFFLTVCTDLFNKHSFSSYYISNPEMAPQGLMRKTGSVMGQVGPSTRKCRDCCGLCTLKRNPSEREPLRSKVMCPSGPKKS